MAFAFTALLPVFLTIVLGFAVYKSGLVKAEHWVGVDQLSFYVLFPAIITSSMIQADFGSLPVWRMVGVMISGMATMQILMFVTQKPVRAILKIDVAAWTSVFQGTTRWHTFLGLSIMPMLFGQPGLALGAVAAAAITPLSNASSVIVLSLARSGTRPDFKAITKLLITNPFILAIFAGLSIKLSGVTVPSSIMGVLDLAGKGALGIALLSVGAALKINHVGKDIRPISAAVVLKMFVVPLFMALYCWVYGVDGLPRTVAILAGGVPTAAVSYIFARKMDGDAPLMANIITMQVIVAAFSLPLILVLAG